MLNFKEIKLSTDNIVAIACGAAAAACAVTLVAVRKTAAPWVKALLGVGIAGGVLGTAVSVVGCQKCYDTLKSVKVWSFTENEDECCDECCCCEDEACEEEACSCGCCCEEETEPAVE
ncbi:MAG: hypothetical protein IKD06_02595 [Clostridia bacterium]|nr:hypothetical protein [Clostridia bacterium]